jgi:hypothetical protein
MIAELSRFFEKQDTEVFVSGVVGELLETDCGCETGGPTTDNADINFIRFSVDGFWVEGITRRGQAQSGGI